MLSIVTFAIRILAVGSHRAHVVGSEQTKVLCITFNVAAVEATSVCSNILLSVSNFHVRDCVSHGPCVKVLLEISLTWLFFVNVFLHFDSLAVILLANGSVVELLSQVHGRIHSTITLMKRLVNRPELLWCYVESFLLAFRGCCLRCTCL